MDIILLDTSVYGVLADEGEEDYAVVKKIIEYAIKHREHFVTTAIISKELNSEDMSKSIRDVILPEYYSSLSPSKAVLEVVFSHKILETQKLAWNYIQRLEKEEAGEVMDDALNYAWSSIARVDVFVTRNRRGVLAENYHRILEKSNRKLRLPFVRIITPIKFYELLSYRI